GGIGQGGFGQGGQNQLLRGANAGAIFTTSTTRTTGVRLVGTDPKGTPVSSGFLEDVHITPDIRSNTLLISAPEKTLKLIETLVRELDVPSAARAGINIFTLKKADATLTANLLQQLFLGGARTGAGVQPNIPGQTLPGNLQGGGANVAATRPLLSLSGDVSPGAVLVNIQIVPDERTNTILVAGSPNDLETIGAILARLDDTPMVPRSTQVVKLKFASAVDVSSTIQPFFQGLITVLTNAQIAGGLQQLQNSVVLAPDPITNRLLINAAPEVMGQILNIIEQLDTEPNQVSVEVLIAEVVLNNGEEFGVEIGLQTPILFDRAVAGAGGAAANSTTPLNFNTTATPAFAPVSEKTVGFQGLTNYGVGRVGSSGVGGFIFSASSDTLNVLVRALKSQGRIDTLSAPRISTLDNQVGQIFVGQNFPFVAGAQINQFGNVIPIIDRAPLGILLRVTPRISPEGRVLMRIEPQISSLETASINLGGGIFAQAFNEQSISTTVVAGDGETIVIGGLMTKSNSRVETKIPWLGDLPYIGAAFRYRTQTQSKRELLLIMTPRVLRGPADQEKLLMEEARKMNWVLKDIEKIYGNNAGSLPKADAPGVNERNGSTLPAPAPVPSGPGVIVPTEPTPSIVPPSSGLPIPTPVPTPPSPPKGGTGDMSPIDRRSPLMPTSNANPSQGPALIPTGATSANEPSNPPRVGPVKDQPKSRGWSLFGK
ncbi:MAG: hypothetical protein N2112_10700, partial [Gemmataceae bacterium]|nr:hypothetical protein [Gemmataceae bacterium]